MQNFKCPHCHQATITPLKKQMISPVAPIPCPGCDKDVGVAWSALWIYAPFLIAIPLTSFIESSALYWGVWVVIAAITFWLNHAFVPLVAK